MTPPSDESLVVEESLWYRDARPPSPLLSNGQVMMQRQQQQPKTDMDDQNFFDLTLSDNDDDDNDDDDLIIILDDSDSEQEETEQDESVPEETLKEESEEEDSREDWQRQAVAQLSSPTHHRSRRCPAFAKLHWSSNMGLTQDMAIAVDDSDADDSNSDRKQHWEAFAPIRSTVNLLDSSSDTDIEILQVSPPTATDSQWPPSRTKVAVKTEDPTDGSLLADDQKASAWSDAATRITAASGHDDDDDDNNNDDSTPPQASLAESAPKNEPAVKTETNGAKRSWSHVHHARRHKRRRQQHLPSPFDSDSDSDDTPPKKMTHGKRVAIAASSTANNQQPAPGRVLKQPPSAPPIRNAGWSMADDRKQPARQSYDATASHSTTTGHQQEPPSRSWSLIDESANDSPLANHAATHETTPSNKTPQQLCLSLSDATQQTTTNLALTAASTPDKIMSPHETPTQFLPPKEKKSRQQDDSNMTEPPRAHQNASLLTEKPLNIIPQETKKKRGRPRKEVVQKRQRKNTQKNQKKKRGRPKKSLGYESDISTEEPAEEEFMDMIGFVEHMSKSGVDPTTGYPFSEFCIHGRSDAILYKFQITVRQSNIPGGGLGAFLTYVGALRLKPQAVAKGKRLMAHRRFYHPKTYTDDGEEKEKRLVAVPSNGIGVEITLAGKNLDRNDNCHYWPKTKIPLEASLPGRNDPVKVFLVGEDLHEGEIHEPIEHPIGHLGIHQESDYVPEPNKTFSNPQNNNPDCGLIKIGRYGPFRKEDRKREDVFDLKSFIFDAEPSGWSFGVEESLLGHSQMIDITDDVTGELHDLAKQSITTYVNEVGYDPKLKQNVKSMEENNRNVAYFLEIDSPMKPGEQVELLTDYFAAYEDVRERKGYGKKNLNNATKSDEDEETYLKRNREERHEMTLLIQPFSLFQLYEVMEALELQTRKPLEKLTRKFLQEYKEGKRDQKPPSLRQWIAMRRLAWLATVFHEKLEKLRSRPNRLDSVGYPGAAIANQCREWINKWKWSGMADFVRVFKNSPDSNFRRVYSSVCLEITEEITYDYIRTHPLQKSMWCQISRDLVQNVCELAASSLLTAEDRSRNVSRDFVKQLVALSKDAAFKVRDACRRFRDGDKTASDLLSFHSGVEETFGAGPLNRLKRAVSKSLRGFGNSPFFENTTLPKGFLAAQAETQAYLDAIMVGGQELANRSSITIAPYSSSDFVMSTFEGFADPAMPLPVSLAAVPRRAEQLSVLKSKINEQWYLVWQIAFPLDCIAKSLKLDPKSYSVEMICQVTGCQLEPCQKAIGVGIGQKYLERLLDPKKMRDKNPKDPAKKTKKTQVPKKRSPGGKALVANNFLFWNLVWVELKKLGWNLDVGTRPRDFYFLPPGVKRGRGFSNRTDYWDSIALVLLALENHPAWKDRKEVIECLNLRKRCLNLLASLKNQKKCPTKKELTMDWLKNELEKQGK